MEQTPPPTPSTAPRRPIRKQGLPPVALALLAFLFGIGAGYVLWGRPLDQARKEAAAVQISATQQAEKQAQAPQDEDAPTRYDIPVGDNPMYGPADAKITIIEFSDFECPYCRKWTVEVWPKLRQEYEGKIRLVYRDYPLYGVHANAASAAEAANCAHEQGQFWPFHDKLFERSQGFSQDAYQSYAQEIGLDAQKFTECVEQQKYKKTVEDDFAFASEFGIRSAPTFFINGLAIVGAQPYMTFKRIIDDELAGKIP